MSDLLSRIRTPPRGFSLLASLLGGPALPALAARMALRRARRKARPLKIGNQVLAVRHADVSEVLRRDLDFRIAPINAERIEQVNGGPFVLGMDRSARLIRERGALYAALAITDLEALDAQIRSCAAGCLAVAGDRLDGLGDYARPVASATARALFGIDPPDKALFAETARAIFAHTFLNLGNDPAIERRALAAAPLMHDWFENEIRRRRETGDFGIDLMGLLLRQARLDDAGVRRTLGGMLVGSIDTTVSTVARILCVVLRDRSLAERMLGDWAAGRDIWGLCQDSLRRWPHNPILLRQAAADTTLAGVKVRAGARVIAWTEAAMQDPEAFPDPGRILPDRPTTAYLHFGAGLHPCAGRAINALQIPILVGCALEAGVRRAGPLQWAGPFPDHLPLRKG